MPGPLRLEEIAAEFSHYQQGRGRRMDIMGKAIEQLDESHKKRMRKGEPTKCWVDFGWRESEPVRTEVG